MEVDNIFPYRNMDIKLGGREMANVIEDIRMKRFLIILKGCQNST